MTRRVLLALLAALAPQAGARAALPPCGPELAGYDLTRTPVPGAYAGYIASARRRECLKPWTVLVYMAADNDLAPYARWDLYEMEAGYRSGRPAAGSTARADVLVQLNAPGAREGVRLHVFQSPEAYDPRLTYRDAPDARSPVASRVPLAAADGAPLAPARDFERFVEWGVREYPSEHYLVVAWGHGHGWGGIAESRTSGLRMTVPELAGALRAVEERALGGRRIDVYASDACLMQSAETAAELAPAARFVTGSSQVSNFLGLPYRRLLFEINTGRLARERNRPGVAGSGLEDDEGYLVARMLPRLFRMSLERGGLHGTQLPGALETATLSSVSSDELERGLLPALGRVGRALVTYLAEDGSRRVRVAGAMGAAPAYLGGTQELGAFLALLRRELEDEARDTGAAAGLRAAIDAARLALDRAVIAYELGPRYRGAEGDTRLLGLRGLSTWLPARRDSLEARLDGLAGSRLHRALGPEWGAWMRETWKRVDEATLRRLRP